MQKPPRNRAWRKAHLAVEAKTGQVVASHLTVRRTHDCTQVTALLEQIYEPIATVSGDGAYDTKAVYEVAHERGEGRAVRVLIPPRRDAQLSPKSSTECSDFRSGEGGSVLSSEPCTNAVRPFPAVLK